MTKHRNSGSIHATMKKLFSLIMFAVFIYGLSAAPTVNAQAVFGPNGSTYTPDYQPVGCGSTSNSGSYGCVLLPTCIQNNPMYSTSCRCPNGAIFSGGYGYYAQCNWNNQITCWDGSTATNQNSCPSYKYCPNDSYTKRSLSYACPNVYIQDCKPTVPGMSYTMDAAQCKCPNGNIVWGNGQGYTSQCTWNTNVVCWDGSTAINQNSCPSYKFCPNDSTKRSLWYQCPSEMKTCPNGTVVPTYQDCPTPIPTCSYYEYWDGYRCVNTYSPHHPNYNQQDNFWFNWWSNSNYWDWGYNYYW